MLARSLLRVALRSQLDLRWYRREPVELSFDLL